MNCEQVSISFKTYNKYRAGILNENVTSSAITALIHQLSSPSDYHNHKVATALQHTIPTI